MFVDTSLDFVRYLLELLRCETFAVVVEYSVEKGQIRGVESNGGVKAVGSRPRRRCQRRLWG